MINQRSNKRNSRYAPQAIRVAPTPLRTGREEKYDGFECLQALKPAKCLQALRKCFQALKVLSSTLVVLSSTSKCPPITSITKALLKSNCKHQALSPCFKSSSSTVLASTQSNCSNSQALFMQALPRSDSSFIKHIKLALINIQYHKNLF
uniref:Uncharacterized protein n=1 Tax=Photinus pyralis TaxID=7054 RepID=A0A1Y1NPI2_PHOPY